LFLGFIMFALLFYIPLLLQGGFGLTPQEVGFLITPLVVSITVASIANGRIVTRIPKPNYMLYLGFALLVIACLGIISVHKSTSRWLLAFYMMLGGSGLGFIMPNLTVFAQEVAGRSALGI